MRTRLPLASIRWHGRPGTGTSRGAEVIVDGKPVARLPVRSFQYSHADPGEIPLVAFTLAAGDADIETYDPARSTP